MANLTQRLTHPSSKLRKVYHRDAWTVNLISLSRPKMKKGFPIEEGFARMDEISIASGQSTVKVVLTQGLKRQIREMFFRLRLRECGGSMRIQIGDLELGQLPDLAPGQHRVLTQC